MKGYVVTLTNIPQSVKVAERCVESAKKYNVQVYIFDAHTKEMAREVLTKEKLNIATFDETWSNTNAALANFASQYQIWKNAAKQTEPTIVLEHDAVFVDYIPNLDGKGDIINLGKPSYGKFSVRSKPGIYPMFSKEVIRHTEYGVYIPGAHGYYITPNGAQQLVEKAKQLGAMPCDLFLNTKNFPDIKEIYPWPIEAHDTFSTIQKVKGCIAKHNYNKDFSVI